MKKRSDLRPSQLEAIKASELHSNIMLAMGMGLGKTVSAATIALDKIETMRARHALIVAPLLVAEEVWPAELEEWEHLRGATKVLLSGTPKKRAKQAETLPDFTIVNGELIPWLVDFWGDRWPYDMLIIDEVSRFKSPKKITKPTVRAVEKATEEVMKRCKDEPDHIIEKRLKMALSKLKRGTTRFGALSSVRPAVRYVVALTGTIISKSLLDLWSQYYLVDGGKRLGESFYKFREDNFNSDYMGYSWDPRPGTFEAVTGAVRDITVAMRTEDHVSLPPLIPNTIHVTLPRDARERYDELARDMQLDMPDEELIEAINAGVLSNKLLQVCNGAIYKSEKEGVDGGDYITLHDAKINALDSVIQEALGAPVLIGYAFQHDLARLKAKYPKAEVVGEAKNLQKRWDAGEIPILLAHPAAAGHGLNLQHGSCVMVWFGLTWSLELYAQMCKRLHRPGQTEPVVIHHIVCRDTIEGRVAPVLADRAKLLDSFIEAM